MSNAAPQPRENQGQPAPRIDGRLKVTGEATYAADIPLNNMAYAVLVTSTIARGTLSALDLRKAKAVPGVLDILSHGDVNEAKAPVYGNSTSTSLGPLHTKQILHDGQILAVVVADTLEAASEAADLVSVSYAAKNSASASFGSPGTLFRMPGHSCRFSAMLFSLIALSDSGQASDPETSPPISARCAGDTAARLVAHRRHPGVVSVSFARATDGRLNAPPARQTARWLWQRAAWDRLVATTIR